MVLFENLFVIFKDLFAYYVQLGLLTQLVIAVVLIYTIFSYGLASRYILKKIIGD